MYEAKISKNGIQLQEPERVMQTLVLTNEDVEINYRLVYDDGSSVPESERRTADDESSIDTDCTAEGVPYSYCKAKDYAFHPSPLKTPCSDNNFSLNALGKPKPPPSPHCTARCHVDSHSCHDTEGCSFPNGTLSSYCVQVAYSQNAYIAQCKGDSAHCGTYLEVHQQSGSPYQAETDLIAEVQLADASISGYSTTVLPLLWMGDPAKVLCSYTESFLRAGSVVYVNPSAPVCCCPQAYSASTRLGSYQCPIGPYGRGAFATRIKTIAEALVVDNALAKYPFCHSGLDAEDRVMCSVMDSNNAWQFSRNCSSIAQLVNSTLLSSRDLGGSYAAACPYYSSCGLRSNATQCGGVDSAFSFIGRVGRVVALDETAVPATVDVTFNDGRSAYTFLTTDVKLEQTKSMYELWWVQRTNSEFVVQKRKGFNVTFPACTFDPLFQRYFPYAVLDANGNPTP